MKKLKIMTVLGTRPEIIRLSEIIKELDRTFDHILVHTGQNYDDGLNAIFFRDLELRNPNHVLSVAGANGAQTVANTITAVDDMLEKERPDAFLVLGDTNSALSVYAAKRRKIPVFHMEAGNRCFDERVPEEINRRIVDHTSDINLVYSERAREYLLREGFPPEKIIKIGSPLFEVLTVHRTKILKSGVLKQLQLSAGKYFLASIHREENIADDTNFLSIMSALRAVAETYTLPIIVTTHPRTRKRLDTSGVSVPDLARFVQPFGFIDYVHLEQNAACVLSDSGTISEESSLLNFPAVNIREAHERPEATDEAVLAMSGLRPERVIQAIELARSYRYGDTRDFEVVADYAVSNVSKKVPKIILSYVDYVNRRVWMKAS